MRWDGGGLCIFLFNMCVFFVCHFVDGFLGCLSKHPTSDTVLKKNLEMRGVLNVTQVAPLSTDCFCSLTPNFVSVSCTHHIVLGTLTCSTWRVWKLNNSLRIP